MNMNGNQKQLFGGAGTKRRLFPILSAILLVTAFWGTNLSAQTLACNGTPSSPLNVGVNNLCEAEIYADDVLEGPANGSYTLVAMTLNGNLIVQGPEPIFIPGDYLGQTIAVTVIEAGGNQCTGYLALEDNLDPLFATCPTIDVSCASDLDPNVIGFPSVSDNCDDNFTLNYFDQEMGPDCSFAPPYIGFVTRTWIATDASGNQSQCVQDINLLAATLADVMLPPDFEGSCETPVDDPAITGMPTIDGNEILNSGQCEFITSYTDNQVLLCPPATHSYLILRDWTIFDECAGESLTYQQVISIEDNTPPVITCPAPITVGAGTDVCAGSFNIPEPTAVDNCSGVLSTDDFDATTTFGGNGFGPFLNIPVGNYMVTYSAEDECGNTSTCTVSLNVIDDVPPTAICDEFTVVSINSLGEAIVPAINLDDGSYDNCSPVIFTGSRDDGQTFNSFLTFDCDDVGLDIDVVIRVTEVNNPASFNDCNVVVHVMDNVPPVVVCPQNETVDCFADLDDLEPFGFPVVIENCPDNITLTSDSTFNFDNCGEGYIVRTFTATDGSGNTDNCSQTITVVNQTPYDGSTIFWPPDTTIFNACAAPEEFHPDSLPAPHNYPDIPDHPCTLPAWNFSDQLFYINYPGCYKIIRTWTVIDWCTYDPQNPNDGGIWYETQIIKLEDSEAPVLTVPGTQVVAVGPDCGETFVDIPLATATDCNTNLTFENDSPYADTDGADASGLYPLGETLVTFTVSDGCGNAATATVLVRVEDQTPPTPTCIDLVAELSDLGPPDDIFVPVDPNVMLQTAVDNCTLEEDVQVFIQPEGASGNPPSTTEWIFTCDDLGENEMEIWVVDEEGNGDFCVVTVIVQDNLVTCPPMQTTATIAGFVESEDGEMIIPSEVSVSGGGGPDQTQTGGDYIFELPVGGDYSISAELDDDPTNGVTTYDLVLISKHILGVQPLDSPYKIIAADANASGSVSTLDMVAITKVILFMDENFTNNTSWRFVDADYQFPEPSDPFAEVFPEVLNYNDLEEDDLAADFVGIKIGDVNGSADPNLGNGPENRNIDGYTGFALADEELRAGEIYELTFYANQAYDLAAWQFTLDFDPYLLRIEDVDAGRVPGLADENFALFGGTTGMATAAWFHHEDVRYEADQIVFTVEVMALADARLQDAVDINSRLTAAEAYNESGERFELGLTFRGTGSDAGFELLPSRPNPFTNYTTVGWTLPERTEATLIIYDLTGKVIYSQTAEYESGYHEVELERSLFTGEGTYFYRLETNNFSATRRMILLGR